MPHRKGLKVAVLLSGGVDSSVALRLLNAAGHSCIAFYLKIWFQEDFENFWTECPLEEDMKYAKAVYDQVDVPLEVHLTDEYWKNVVCSWMPSAVWNLITLLLGIMPMLSTHLRIIRISLLCRIIKRQVKDQMYFLSHLSQAQLRRLIFHLEEVRKLATKFDLRNKDKKDSWGICFLGKTHWVVEGIILEAETGDFLEKHRGFWFYTIGQHQELVTVYIIFLGYVVEKDIENNIVFVSRNYYSFDKKRHLFHAGSLKLLSGLPPEKISQLQCKQASVEKSISKRTLAPTRLSSTHPPLAPLKFETESDALLSKDPHFPTLSQHIADLKTLVKTLHRLLEMILCNPSSSKGLIEQSAHLTIEHCEDGGEDIAVVQLSEDDQGLAAGQFAAFYQGRRCLGSGVILEAWDDQGFPVCKKALEIARMEDKSKLGKPVKIKVKLQTPMEFDNNKGIESSRNLFNGQNGVVENRNTTSQVQEEAIPRFPGNWMHKLSEKWTHCVA
ncbi:hypothetical protein CUMW_097640, partial [Citrus unshiu]